MSVPLWRLAVRSEFSAAHALRHYRGKCEAVHGHNFAVEVLVEGKKLDEETELLMDFKEIKNRLKEVLEKLDHQDLNQLPFFGEHNPSSENISAWIFKNLRPFFAGEPVRLVSVTVAEKSTQSATYMEI
ncbi:MAG: 6-carboxytetrahydropterin synthase QueD [Deltaproteobacteria bacterium]|jgi:6-pyruvoyltetrahydropterin/6-carboxytetrahydropterin synthase|nr:6-carboxytetrahydropterin synthase QueD [Deltaproteobacteria bacterium]